MRCPSSFSSTAIALNVPPGEFSSIPFSLIVIELTFVTNSYNMKYVVWTKLKENTYDLKRVKVLCGWDQIVGKFLQFWKTWIKPSCRKIVGKYLRFENNESFMWMEPNRTENSTDWKMWIEPRVKVLCAWDQIVGKMLQFERCGLNQVVGKS